MGGPQSQTETVAGVQGWAGRESVSEGTSVSVEEGGALEMTEVAVHLTG